VKAISLICKAIRKIKLILIYKEKQKKLYNVLKTYMIVCLLLVVFHYYRYLIIKKFYFLYQVLLRQKN